MSPVVFQDTSRPLPVQQTEHQPAQSIAPSTAPFMGQALQQRAPVPLSNTANRFSINDLAPRQEPLNFYQSPYQPPTPPPEEEYEAMDWTPSQQGTLRPATLIRPSPTTVQQHQPNPFQGRLPADIVSMEHRLRNPPNKPTFRKASETKKQNFFNNLKNGNPRVLDNMSDTTTEYEPSVTDSVLTPTQARTVFADPKLRLPSDQQSITGLEPLLAGSFSLNDEPPEIRAQREEARARAAAKISTYGSFAVWHRAFAICLLGASCFSWQYTLKPSLFAYQDGLRQMSLGLSSLLSIRSIWMTSRGEGNNQSFTNAFVYLLQLVVSIALATDIQTDYRYSSCVGQEASITLGCWFMVLMTLQETILLARELIITSQNTENLDPGTDSRAQEIYDVPTDREQVPPKSEPAQRSSSRSSTVKPSRTRGTKQTFEVTQRTTRSKASTGESPGIGNGLGGLSLGSAGATRQLRSNRNGMW